MHALKPRVRVVLPEHPPCPLDAYSGRLAIGSRRLQIQIEKLETRRYEARLVIDGEYVDAFTKITVTATQAILRACLEAGNQGFLDLGLPDHQRPMLTIETGRGFLEGLTYWSKGHMHVVIGAFSQKNYGQRRWLAACDRPETKKRYYDSFSALVACANDLDTRGLIR